MQAESLRPERFRQVFDISRDLLSREFQRAERFDAKARGVAGLAASWFMVAQAATALTIDRPPMWGVYVVLGCSLVGGMALCALLLSVSRVWRLRVRDDLTPESLEAMRVDVEDGAPDFEVRTISTYEDVLAQARAVNSSRASALNPKTRRWRHPDTYWVVILASGVLEIVAGFASRLG